jgi:PmbA protein
VKLEKELKTLEGSAGKLLQFALDAGASQAEVCGTFGQRTKIALEKQDYHLASSDEGYNLGIRVLKGDRQGFASCNTTDAAELKEIALRAVEIAGFSPPNPYYVINRSEPIPKTAPATPWDDKLFGLSLQTQKEWTKVMVDEALRDPRFRMNEGSLGTSAGAFVLLNSEGVSRNERECSLYWSLMGMGVDGEKITSFDYFSDMAQTSDGVVDRIVATTREFCARTLSGLEQGSARSYKGLVVFTPRAVQEILTGSLLYHLNGRVLTEKIGRWKLEDLGKLVVDKRLTLRDMPWLPGRTGFSRFDREGVPTQNRKLIDGGKIAGWLLDGYSAKALGLQPTGNSAGGPSAPPNVSAHSLVLDGGDEPLAQGLKRLAEAQKDGFLVVHRYSGQSDPVTGEFSGVAKGGEWWEGGKRRHCVQETMIAGNLFEVLSQGVFSVSKETELIDSAEESPTLILDGVSVTSA